MIVTGFLESGKTTFLNQFLNSGEFQSDKLLLLQFELGEEEFESRHHNCDMLEFSIADLEQRKWEITQKIAIYLDEHDVDEIWVEWNGMASFAALQSLFSSASLYKRCSFEKVICFSNADTLEITVTNAGAAITEQLANCDIAIVRHMTDRTIRTRITRLIHNFNPGVRICRESQIKKIGKKLYRGKAHPVSAFSLAIFWFILLFLILRSSSLPFPEIPVGTLMNVFSGIMLQAIPFLLIGVLISSAIQILLPDGLIERWFPKRLAPSMLVAVLFGFCLPVCDCASVPIFRSLLKKGIPLPAAVTFLAATPVINPVVMLSTYYAFNGSLRVVLVRVGLGILSALLAGLLFAIISPKAPVFSQGFDKIMCSCGCYDRATVPYEVKGKLGLFLRHSQAEFFNVGKYLIIGAFVSALLQAVGLRSLSVQSGAGFALSLAVMMALAFLLSLCSSSDAVVARSLSSNFAAGSTMGFLVFGPMMDIKNILMLSGSFSKKFVGLLFTFTFSACYFVVFLFARALLGV